MITPFNGWQAKVAIQKETTFDAPSSEAVYDVTGKTRFTQSLELLNPGHKVNVWRMVQTATNAGQYFRGSIEMELGLNPVVALILQHFFEVESATAGGFSLMGEGGDILGEGGGPIYGEGDSLTNYVLRPPRLQKTSSLKIGLEFPGANVGLPILGEGDEPILGEGGGEILGEGGGSFVFSGAVIDSLVFDVRRNQVPKLLFNFKAASRSGALAPVLGSNGQSVTKRRVEHERCAVTLNSAALALTEASLSFAHSKQPARFTNRKPTRFACGAFSMTGQLAEYLSPDAPLHGAIADQDERSFYFIANDADGERKLEVTWPASQFTGDLPEGIGHTDIVYRASFNGLENSARVDAGPKIVLVV